MSEIHVVSTLCDSAGPSCFLRLFHSPAFPCGNSLATEPSLCYSMMMKQILIFTSDSYVSLQTFLHTGEVQFLPKKPIFPSLLTPTDRCTSSPTALTRFWKFLDM